MTKTTTRPANKYAAARARIAAKNKAATPRPANKYAAARARIAAAR